MYVYINVRILLILFALEFAEYMFTIICWLLFAWYENIYGFELATRLAIGQVQACSHLCLPVEPASVFLVFVNLDFIHCHQPFPD